VVEEKPYSYDAKTKETVPSSFVLNGDVLSFNIAAHEGTTVIDPSIHWSTYFGGPDLEYAYGVSTDTLGNSYIAGHTTSSTGVATTGAFSTVYAGNKDAFLAKFNPLGVLQWCTYYGGAASDNFFYIVNDTLGYVYASGVTSSTAGISTTGSHQSSYGGGASDAYLVKFDSNGIRQWATYYGGSGDEAIPASFDDYMVAVAWSRATNNVYLCGITNSTTGIATTGCYQPLLGGGKDGYIVQFNSSGVRQWGTYYGGSNDDKIIKMACSDNGYVYATGPTYSTSSIATVGTHQTTLGGGSDAFVAKFTSTGNLSWATYLGGPANDDPAGIAVDNAGAVYLAGSTVSNAGIATNGSFQFSIAGTGPTDAYLEKFTPSGQRVWGTYFGGTQPDFTADIAIDGTGNICFSGFTGSNNISTAGAYQFLFGGNSDAFIAIFGPSGTRSWVSYLGGTNADNATAISFSRTGDLFITGSSSSQTNVATTGAYQSSLGGMQDGFLAKFFADTSAYVLLTLNPLVYCAGDSMYVPYGVTNPFLPGNTFTVQLSDPGGTFNAPVNLGSVSGTLGGVIPCKIPVGVTPSSNYRIRLSYSSPAGYGYPNNYNIQLKLLPEKPTITKNSPICSSNDLMFTGTSTTTGVNYSWTGPNSFTSTKQTDTIPAAATSASGRYIVEAIIAGCVTRDTFIAQVDSTPVSPIVGSNSPVCAGSSIALTAYSATAGANYTWVGPGFTSTSQNPNIASASSSKVGYYKATAHLGACSTIDSTMVEVIPMLTPKITIAASPGTQICLGDLVTFTATSSNGGTYPAYKWYLNGVQIPGANTWYWTSTALLTGDVVSCVFVGDWPCLAKPTDTSNKILMNASGNVAPTVTIKATPGLSVPSGSAVTFVATNTNGGNVPTYKWVKNSSIVLQKSSSNVYIGKEGIDFKSGDNINAIMVSDLVCADPDSAISNTLTIKDNVILLNVGNTLVNNQYSVYPNPTQNELHIDGLTKGMNVQLFDVLGKQVMKATTQQEKIVLNTSGLIKGTYILQLADSDGNRTNIKVVKQ
jgi:hypothetical protein